MVDDEPNVLSAFERQLRGSYDIHTTHRPEEALQLINSGERFAVVVVDMHMPGLNGIELLAEIKKIDPSAVRVMLTGNADQKTAVSAINSGQIFRFLNKPCSTEQLTEALEASLEQYQLYFAERELLQRTLQGSIHLLVELINIVDPALMSEVTSLRKPVDYFTAELGDSSAWATRIALTLSAIGPILLPPALASRVHAGIELTKREQEIVNKNPDRCYELVKNIPRLDAVAEILRFIEKRFDGTGPPEVNIRGQCIPLGSRIIKALRDFQLLREEFEDPRIAYERMSWREGWYDPAVFDLIGRYFELVDPPATVEETGPASSEPELLTTTVANLETDQLVKEDIVTNDNVLLVKAGSVLTDTLIARIKNYHSFVGVVEPLTVVVSGSSGK
jgi:response regulator RpfG family c-di-GMP phosphodiesterase